MKVRTAPIVARYRYDPALAPVHGSPLWDIKRARAVPPTVTVRIGAQYLTPKQIVYLLHLHPQLATESEPNPTLTMPAYILNLDGDSSNILVENLKPANTTRRWGKPVTYSGAFIPDHLRTIMTAEDRLRMGISDDE
jgi:hypothetical protein